MSLTKIDVGTAANDGTGQTLRAAFTRINDNYDVMYADGTLKVLVCTGTLDDTTPTIAQINTVTGLTPATADTGCVYILKNTTVTAYYCTSDGTNWHVVKMTKITV
jgi:hypothetical protein